MMPQYTSAPIAQIYFTLSTTELPLPVARWCYSALFYFLTPLLLCRLWWRGRLAPAYRRRIGERFGYYRAALAPDGIWVHAVSVGETIAAAPMIRALRQRHPHLPITVTTMTPTGSERVRALFGNSVQHIYAPYDLPDAVARLLRRLRPRLAIIVETELWPNTIHGCAARGIPVLLANARLSERSARGYRRLSALTAPMLRELALVAAQNADDGARFTALGLPETKLVVSGSIKFDIAIDAELQARAQRSRAEWSAGGRPIWIAASTHAGEDEIVLAAHRQLRERHPQALLILVPRHPERFDAVAALIEAGGFSCARRSRAVEPAANTAVLLGDTMGELLYLYGCADVALVGGSLIARGGHNTLEPAAWGLPIITGPSAFNFREIAALLESAQALVVVDDGAALARELSRLVDDAELRRARGAAAKRVVEENRGALEKLLAEIDRLLEAR